ncbi:hypothetical protein EI94DRAFT_1211877 [Lactarius quietus]|nr:hypothetical protein EI94DRAFT_1211877 [Lactarius quietus]
MIRQYHGASQSTLTAIEEHADEENCLNHSTRNLTCNERVAASQIWHRLFLPLLNEMSALFLLRRGWQSKSASNTQVAVAMIIDDIKGPFLNKGTITEQAKDPKSSTSTIFPYTSLTPWDPWYQRILAERMLDCEAFPEWTYILPVILTAIRFHRFHRHAKRCRQHPSRRFTLRIHRRRIRSRAEQRTQFRRRSRTTHIITP